MEQPLLLKCKGEIVKIYDEIANLETLLCKDSRCDNSFLAKMRDLE